MSPRGHRLPFPILAGIPLLMAVLLLLSTATGQEADDHLPPGPNPLRFLGFASLGKTQNKLEIELGNVMNGNVYEAVEIWATLQINDTTYVPGPCPSKDDKEESIAKFEDGVLSLSFFFGRPGDFTSTYLKIEAPNRFYSLSALSGKILFANKDRTLKLALQNDSENEFVWANSSLTERRSFLHFMVNQTLQNTLRRVTQSDRILDGDVFIRDTASQTGSGYPYLFGEVDKYLRCEHNEFPSNFDRRNHTEQYNTSFCSGWGNVEEENHSLKVLAEVILDLEYIVVALSVTILLNAVKYGWWPFLVTENIFYKEGEIFPRFLSAKQVIFGNAPSCDMGESSSGPQGKFWGYKIANLVGVVVFILAFMLILLLASYRYYFSNYNVSDVESSTCWQSHRYGTTIVLTTILAICLLLYSAFVFVRAGKDTSDLVFVFLVISIPTAVCLTVILVNVLIIACYTLVGLVFFHFETMLSVLAGAIVVVIEIFKVGVMNVTISPEIVKYKAALDAANCKLRAKVCKRARTSKNQSKSNKTISRLRSENVQIVALLRLSAEQPYDAGEKSLLKRLLECRRKEEVALGSDAKLYARLAGEVRYRFWKHLLSSFALAMAALFVLGNAQGLLVHFGELTGLKNFTQLILPTSIAFTYLVGIAKSQFLSANPPSPDKHLLQQAETILMTLTATLPGEQTSTTGNADHAPADGRGGSTALLPVTAPPQQAAGGARLGCVASNAGVTSPPPIAAHRTPNVHSGGAESLADTLQETNFTAW